MALFNRDYDRDFGYRGRPGMWGNYRPGRWDHEAGYGPRRDWNAGDWGYDRDYGYTGGAWGGYDRNYKSRWQTDYGDPFGDRANRTPIRTMRGEFDSGYMPGYGRDYSSNPMGYDPYYNREGTWNRGYGGWNRGWVRGYDRGW